MMDRLTSPYLTKACNDPWDYCGLDKYCKRGCVGCRLPKMIRRLAEYEDTGLTPKEIAELYCLVDGLNDLCEKRLDLEWIRTADRLPETPGFYLVAKRQRTGQLIVAIGHYSGERWSGSGNFTDVTHWMELPDPPGGGS